MAVLYQDQYKAMQRLGTDESFVLSHLACGYDISQIKNGIAKRGDRDTKDDVETIVERIYGKLGINKLLKPSERWRQAGKIHFDYGEMLREKRGPRPGNAPSDEPEPEHVDDDEVLTRHVNEANSAKLDREEVADEQGADTSVAPTPAPTAEPSDIEKMALRIPKMVLNELRVLKAFSENSDIAYVAEQVGLAEGTVRSYLVNVYSFLGLPKGKREGKFERAIQAYRLCAEQEPEALTRALQPKTHALTATKYNIENIAKNIPRLGASYRKILEAALRSSNITDISMATNFSESTIKLYIGQMAAKLGMEGHLDWQSRLLVMVNAMKLVKGSAAESQEVLADAPPEQPAPEESFSLPNEGTVVNLADPTSIEDVKVSSGLYMKKYREAGYTIEHIVLPPDSAPGFTHYIFVKRTKPE